jgi:predicted RNA methylase
MKLKHLESALSEVDLFENPSIELEQVPTSPHIASRMIHTAAETYGDITDQVVGDFGMGTGMLVCDILYHVLYIFLYNIHILEYCI